MKKNTTKKRAVVVKANKPPVFQTSADLRTALLIVSLILNVFVFCIWLTLQLTSQYDAALYDFFIFR